jgi:hypothetical protein
MRPFLRFLAVAIAIALPTSALANDRSLCTISSTSPTATTSNCTGAIKAGIHVAVQCTTGAAWVNTVSASTDAITSSTGVYLQQYALYDVPYDGSRLFVSVLASSGTVSCTVFSRIGTLAMLERSPPPSPAPLLAAFTWPASFRRRADHAVIEAL